MIPPSVSGVRGTRQRSLLQDLALSCAVTWEAPVDVSVARHGDTWGWGMLSPTSQTSWPVPLT